MEHRYLIEKRENEAHKKAAPPRDAAFSSPIRPNGLTGSA
ncbi:hypothetical protein HMPREF9440_01954 [Sutterella parvirubra YIT 11816]|uniref:Uncharacterized protein n=1 Tax=Sutterella parvirubra YIT 11816 TaxID=762967 RepID=H3KGS2_9BURK|nr:hypothetical protein HMPREF9440_01954 [Sutterella parvirubra YIT 11816]